MPKYEPRRPRVSQRNGGRPCESPLGRFDSTISLPLNRETKERLFEVADARKVTASHVIRELIAALLDGGAS